MQPSRRQRVALAAALTALSALAAWFSTSGRGAPPAAPGRDAPGEIVLALAGDAALAVPLDLGAASLRAVAALAGNASLGIANFELAVAAPGSEATDGRPRWPRAAPEAAAQLRRLGFGAMSLANNHAFDSGAEGLALTQAHLDAAGIVHAGAGPNLDAARQPVYVTVPGGTVALVAVAVSHAPGAGATARSGDINGRPGVNGIRLTRRLTVDPAGFAALVAAFPPAVLTRNPDGVTWNLMGVTVAQGDVGGMTLVADAGDVARLEASVREARRRSAVVVVSVHAHEPGNRVDEVAEVLRRLAHAAVDAGADVVHGHGPHRLRGVELYRERPIFYSLGNLVFPGRGLRAEAADEFEDHARDVRSPLAGEEPRQLDFSDGVWWQSAMAMVRLDHGRVVRVELHPLDLGGGQDATQRGRPALAAGPVGSAILERLRALSTPLGTTIAVENGIGVVRR